MGSILTGWHNKQIIELFRLPKSLFSWLLFSNVIFTQKLGFSFLGLYTTLVAAFVTLLIGFHLHYFLVRNGQLKQLFGRTHKREYVQIVADIVHHKQFLKLKKFHHHTDHIYDHVKRVSYIAYVLAKTFGLDYQSAARGGLLHDFFLYDWRQRKATDVKKSNHGKEHPYVALANSEKHFSINPIVADSIVKHMWPKTKERPLYKESYIVSLADKIATVIEYTLFFFASFKRLIIFSAYRLTS